MGRHFVPSVGRVDAFASFSHGPPVCRLVFVLKPAPSPTMGRHFMSSVVRVDASDFPFHGPPDVVLTFVPAAAASRPAPVAGAESGSSGIGFPRTPAAAASRRAPVAGAESGSSGIGFPRTPAAAAVAVSFVAVPAVAAFAPAAAA
jgi:hypothetical protein